MESINTEKKIKIKKRVTFIDHLVKGKRLSNDCLLDILHNHHSDLNSEFVMDMISRCVESR